MSSQLRRAAVSITAIIKVRGYTSSWNIPMRKVSINIAKRITVAFLTLHKVSVEECRYFILNTDY